MDVPAPVLLADAAFEEALQKVAPNINPPKTLLSFMKARQPTPSIPSKLTLNFVLPYQSEISSKEVPGVTDLGLIPGKISRVAILGGGLMGSGIATALIFSNFPMKLKEVNEKFHELV